MGKELLVRETKALALSRMEDAARTPTDFRAVVKKWNQLDENQARRVRRHEIGRPNEMMLHWDRIDESDTKGKLKGWLDVVIPRPLEHPWWRQLISGDFIDTIYDNADEMWQLVEDWDIASQFLGLTAKQKEVLFLSAVRQCSPQQIACYQDKTDRGVRKLLTATIDRIREKLAAIIQEQITAQVSDMTLAKRQFLEWYEEQQKIALDKDKDE